MQYINLILYLSSQPIVRCTAFCQKFLAPIEQARGNANAARCYAQVAREGFVQLSMNQEVAELDDLIDP